jgi:formiminotetrahydrofolate cyclodeaminase
MRSVWAKTLKSVHETTASDKPFATSGAIVIITAVYACSLVLMTLKIATRKKHVSGRLDKIKALVEILQKQTTILASLADKDILVFQKYLTALQMPATTQSLNQRKAKIKKQKIQSALVPLETAKQITIIFPLLHAAIEFCPDSLLSDILTAANLLNTCLKSTVLNVEVNTVRMKQQEKDELLLTCKKLMANGSRYTRNINATVRSKIFRVHIAENKMGKR